MMSKTEIRKRLAKLHTLDKACRIVILNTDCVEQLCIERIKEMHLIMKHILDEREIVLNDLWEEKMDEMESLIDDDGYLTDGWNLGHINYLIHSSETLIEVEVLQ